MRRPGRVIGWNARDTERGQGSAMDVAFRREEDVVAADVCPRRHGDLPAGDDAERQADQRGRDLLIDPDRYHDFVRAGRFGAAEVRELARELGISPGILVGRLRRDGQVPLKRLNGLKKRLTWT